MGGWESAAMMVASGAKAGGQIYSGFAEERGMAEAARVSREQAAWERMRGAIEADDYRVKGSRTQAADLARRAASGVSTTTGTPLATDLETQGAIEYGAQTIMREGMLRAYRLEQEAGLRERKGQNAMAAGFMNAAGTGLTAASELARYARSGREGAGAGVRVGGKGPYKADYTYPVM